MRNLGLTPRERATARCLLEGWDRNEIARQLRVAPGTIKRFSTSVYNKTGQDDQVGLIAFLLWNPWALAQVMECDL